SIVNANGLSKNIDSIVITIIGTQIKMNDCNNNEVKKRNFLCNSSNIKPRKKTSSGNASYINAVIVLIKMEMTTLVVRFILRFSIPPNKYAVKIPSPSNIKGKTIPIAIFVDEFTPFKPILLRDPGLFLFRIYNTMSVNPVKIPPCRSMATFRFISWASIKYRPTLPDIKRNTDINVKYKNNRPILNLIDSKWILL